MVNLRLVKPPGSRLVPQSGDWEHPVRWVKPEGKSTSEKKPWELTPEEFETNPPSGFKYDPAMRPGLAGHSAKDVITIGPHIMEMTELGRMLLITHEEGHQVISPKISDWIKEGLLEPFRQHKDTSSLSVHSTYDNPFGLNSRPEELLSDAYSDLVTGEYRHYRDREVYANLFHAIAIQALSMGKDIPDRDVIFEDFPDLKFSKVSQSRALIKGLLYKVNGRPRFRRVKATNSKRPGYIGGTATSEREFLHRLRELRDEGLEIVVAAVEANANQPLRELLREVNRSFTLWAPKVLREAIPTVLRMYSDGLRAGIAEAGMAFGPELANVAVVNYMANQPTGLVPTLQGMIEEERAFAEQTVRQSYEAGQVFDLDDVVKQLKTRVDREDWRLERIVRTETRKISGLGRLAGWEADPRRELYSYHYIATVDERTRSQHTRFMREGPYAFERIRDIWEDEREPFNCRCTMARTLRSKTDLIESGLITTEEAEELY